MNKAIFVVAVVSAGFLLSLLVVAIAHPTLLAPIF